MDMRPKYEIGIH